MPHNSTSGQQVLLVSGVICIASFTLITATLLLKTLSVETSFASEIQKSDPRYARVICGPQSLSNALGLIGSGRSATEIAAQCRVTSLGVAMSDLEQYANSIRGVQSELTSLGWSELLGLDAVAVLFVDGDHFIAVDPRRMVNTIVAYDGDAPARQCPKKELMRRWDGKALIIRRNAGAYVPAGPHIVWESCYVNNGLLNGSPAECVFSFRNSGDADLLVNDVKVACGCMSCEVSSYRVSPGEAASLVVKVRTEGKEGLIREKVVVKTNDPVDSVSVLRLGGAVPRKRSVSTDVIRLGELTRGGNVVGEFCVGDPEFGGGRVEEVLFVPNVSEMAEHLSFESRLELIGGSVNVSSVPIGYRTGQDHLVRVTISADAQCPVGELTGDVVVRMRSMRGVETSKITIKGSVVADVYAVPRAAIFSVSDGGRNSQRAIVKLRSHSGRPILVKRNWSDLPSIRVSRSAGDEVTFSVTASEELSARLEGTIRTTIHLELEDASIIDIPVIVLRPKTLATVK